MVWGPDVLRGGSVTPPASRVRERQEAMVEWRRLVAVMDACVDGGGSHRGKGAGFPQALFEATTTSTGGGETGEGSQYHRRMGLAVDMFASGAWDPSRSPLRHGRRSSSSSLSSSPGCGAAIRQLARLAAAQRCILVPRASVAAQRLALTLRAAATVRVSPLAEEAAALAAAMLLHAEFYGGEHSAANSAEPSRAEGVLRAAWTQAGETFPSGGAIAVLETLSRQAWAAGLGPDFAKRVADAVRVLCHAQGAHLVSDPESFREHILPALQSWAMDGPRRALQAVSGAADTSAGHAVYLARSALHKLRADRLFDAVLDYPESTPGVCDLVLCNFNVTDVSFVACRLGLSLHRRLLHPGAHTRDIILRYILLLNALAGYSAVSELLGSLAEPVRVYLSSRAEAILSMISLLTSSKYDNLFNNGGGEEEAPAVVEREPKPLRATEGGWTGHTCICKSRLECQTPDLHAERITKLVEVYGTKDRFVEEYKSLLARRILGGDDAGAPSILARANVAREVRTVELLKLRFGEELLQDCEIIIKDLNDSMRMENSLKDSLERDAGDDNDSGPLPLTTLIVSANFWPASSDPAAQLKVPEDVASAMESVEKRFGQLKAPRKLRWRPWQGMVEVQLSDSAGTVRKLRVKPVDAAVLHCFHSEDDDGGDDVALSAEDVCARVGVAPGLASSVLSRWVSMGVLEPKAGGAGGLFGPVKIFPVGSSMRRAQQMQEGLAHEEEQALAKAKSSKDSHPDYEVYEKFVTGMLTNFPVLPAERIHNMLKMFVTQPAYDKSLPELVDMLNAMVAHDKLDCADGQYKLCT